MEPVFQRLGDVTIQRLEKPKEKVVPQTNSLENEDQANTNISDFNIEELAGLKRSLDIPGSSNKKFKFDGADITVTRKFADETESLPDFSDNEFEDYETESEFESEGELSASEKSLPKPDSEAESSFFDNLLPANEAEPDPEPDLFPEADENVPETHSGDTEDYEYDIKEKLKEMGEISFETVKKGEPKPKKPEPTVENEVVVTPAKKPGDEDVTAENIRGSMLRRNIREVMDETKLDESTLAAQRQEMERLKRVNEQHRFIREVQRQLAQERMQNKVISLLQGSSSAKPGTSTSTRIGNTVLVKLPNGQTKPMTKLAKRPFELVKIPKAATAAAAPGILPGALTGAATALPKNARSLITVKKPPGNLTPSVSIAPVSKKPVAASSARPPSDSDSEESEDFMRRPMPKPRPRPVPPPSSTIDISSDDDCIVVSEPEGEGNMDDTEEDPSNSGMHTNDEFNQPDELGRVVVNIGHPDDEQDIYVAPQIARIIKPHQIGGVRFLFDNLVESVGRFHTSTGFGCILAHSMGLGKTLQVVCFSDIFLRHTPARTILCIMPINTLQNWLAEYNMWLPTEDAAPNSPLQAHGEVRARNFNLHVLNDSHKTLAARAKVIHQWKADGGVLLIGYEQYRLLSMRKYPKSRKKVNPEKDDDKNKLLFDEVHEALVKPGPDLVICDEGHRIKNSHASISQALKQMRTKRRVVLTGYPLQNNLMEYWCMVDFVRPNYLGTKTEFCNMFERPIQNGQCIDSTEADIKLMRYRAHVLHSLLVGFVQRRSHRVLQTALPQKEEYVLLVRMTPFQRTLYETFMNEVVRTQSVPNPLKAFAVCCKIWNHPDVLYYFLKKRAGGDAVDIDLEEVSNSTGTSSELPAKPKRGAPRKNAKKTSGKPEASVTPYSTSEAVTTIPQQPSQVVSNNTTVTSSSNSNSSVSSNSFGPVHQQSAAEPFSDNSNFNYQNDPNNRNFYPQNKTPQNQNKPTNFPPPFSENVNQNNQSFSQQNNYQQQNANFAQNQQFSGGNSYGNYQQNYWGQDQQNLYPSFNNQNFNSPQSWIKKEDIKPIIVNNIINPIKTEPGYSDTKPKINIISDIKLPSSMSITKIAPEKKINILSDIKLDIKKEENDRPDFKALFKDEMKSEPPIPSGEEFKMAPDSVQPIRPNLRDGKEDTGIPYDWAMDLLKDYVPGCIENSAKMEILFCIVRESIALGDRLLVFSQSLITLDLIEQFLQMNIVPGDSQHWAKNQSYYRLDGSTSALEREKLINEFNSNPKIHLFLVSTRAGSLGINLIGANRVVVLDASWNPCHDTQAVCRVYRYGQRKPCFVYRLVVDNCLEKKIYDRQINKQGMSDRVVDECNPDAHLTMKDVSTLCWDDNKAEVEERDWGFTRDNYIDVVLQKVLETMGRRLNKEPFQHESLLVDRKDKQLSTQEKRLAKKGYEREKQASRQPTYNMGLGPRGHRPVASVRPMQQGGERPSRWIPAEHWQRQGMTAQEMTLPLDVVIPTNQADKGNIVLKAGQKVLVLKSPKGVYMQLESGKIVAIKTAIKVRGKAEDNDPTKMAKPALPPAIKNNSALSVLPQKRPMKPFAPGLTKLNMRSVRQPVPNLVSRIQSVTKKIHMSKTKPYQAGNEIAKALSQPDGLDILGLDEHERRMMSMSDEMLGLDEELEQGEIPMRRPLPHQLPRREGGSKNYKQSLGAPRGRGRPPKNTALQQLEQSTSAIMSEKQPFQETLDSITSSYQEEEKLDEQDAQDTSLDDIQDSLSDEVQEISHSLDEQPSTAVGQSGDQPIKTEIPQHNDYGYNNYYNYNPYPPPPPQGYAPGYAPQPAPYDMGYAPPPPPPQQTQYGYGMYPPQGYPPPPPPQHYPPQGGQPYPPPQGGYDYGHPPPPQPMYGGYNPYPQQYPPPPPQGGYPPPAAAPPPAAGYPDYQYPPQNPPAAPPPPQQAPYYPNS